MSPKDFTPVQRKMLAVLSDGRPHKPEELHCCLYDELGETSNIWYHLSCIRKRLRPINQDILCVIHNRVTHYRRVRLFISRRAK